MKFGAIVHGGAGDIPKELEDRHKTGVTEACLIAYEILEKGGSALDAAEAAVINLENNAVFDAGTGSFFNEIGEIEMDAMLATDQWKMGAVCAIQNVKNPIKVARLVMEKSDHVLLVGKGAQIFALNQGIPKITSNELGFSPELKLRFGTTKIEEIIKQNPNHKKLGTVGCACLDLQGHYAIATSTGGSVLKKQGRVGDTAIWGAGGYVDPHGAAVATGLGEDLIRVHFTKTAIDSLKNTPDPELAAKHALHRLETFHKSEGGIVIITQQGFGFSYNTPKMSVAFRDNRMSNVTSHV